MTNTLNWNSIINHTLVPGHGNRCICLVILLSLKICIRRNRY